MKLVVRSTVRSEDFDNSLKQMEQRFAAQFVDRASREPEFTSIGQLLISVTPQHPMFGPQKIRRGYSKSHGLYWVESPADYGLWAAADWVGRTDEYARALAAAVDRIAKTRASETEKAVLRALIEEVCVEVHMTPPENLALVGPTYVSYDEHGEVTGISYSGHHVDPLADRVVEVPAGEAALLLADDPVADAAGPEMFKLYKRTEGVLHYHEAWWNDGKVVEHWGMCGTEGQLREHDASDLAAAEKTMKRLKKDARALGFRPIPPSRHVTLVVEYGIEGFGDETDIGRRHELESYLSERTGWLGVGHCDGGTIGSGTMEVFCVVVNFDLAKAALEKELSGSSFSDFSRIYRSA